MTDRPAPVFRTREEVSLIGTMAIYDSQADASERIPQQWRAFRLANPGLDGRAEFYGASPCSCDGKIHYITGVVSEGAEGVAGGERLVLEAGEYALVHVSDLAALRDTWTWLLREWLPGSGRRERSAPEFERFTGISEDGRPVGPVEIGIPLEGH